MNKIDAKKSKNKALIVSGFVIAVLAVIVFFSFKNKKEETPKFSSPLQNGKIVITENDRILGSSDAKITLVEYSDFQCPYCVKLHSTLERIIKESEGKVRWAYRHSPLSIHKAAPKAAEAAECSGDQGKFWEYVAIMTKNSQPDGKGLAISDLKKYSEELSLNQQQFESCLDGGKFKKKVALDLESGKKLEVQGTPATFLIDEKGNTQLISGALPYEQIKAKIDSALK